MHASRCVLAGDHHQLPPTILSDKLVSAILQTCLVFIGRPTCITIRAAREGLSLTLMERALAVCGKDNVSCMLTQQYRLVHCDDRTLLVLYLLFLAVECMRL